MRNELLLRVIGRSARVTLPFTVTAIVLLNGSPISQSCAQPAVPYGASPSSSSANDSDTSSSGVNPAAVSGALDRGDDEEITGLIHRGLSANAKADTGEFMSSYAIVNVPTFYPRLMTILAKNGLDWKKVDYGSTWGGPPDAYGSDRRPVDQEEENYSLALMKPDSGQMLHEVHQAGADPTSLIAYLQKLQARLPLNPRIKAYLAELYEFKPDMRPKEALPQVIDTSLYGIRLGMSAHDAVAIARKNGFIRITTGFRRLSSGLRGSLDTVSAMEPNGPGHTVGQDRTINMNFTPSGSVYSIAYTNCFENNKALIASAIAKWGKPAGEDLIWGDPNHISATVTNECTISLTDNAVQKAIQIAPAVVAPGEKL